MNRTIKTSVILYVFVFLCYSADAKPIETYTNLPAGILPLNTSPVAGIQKHRTYKVRSFVRNIVAKQLFNGKKDRNPSKTAMILGILALASVLIPWYTILLAIPLGIAAIITGKNASKTNEKDRKKAKAGVILGIISLCLFALILVLGVILFLFILQMTSWGG